MESPKIRSWFNFDLKSLCKLLGPLIIIIILYFIDWHRLGIAIWQLGFTAFFITFIVYAALFSAIVVVKAWRLRQLLPGMTPSITSLSRLVAVSGLWGMATPGRIGDIMRVVYLERAGVERADASIAWASERVLDLASVLALSAATTLAFLLGWGLVNVSIVYLLADIAATFIGMGMLRRIISIPRIRSILERAAGGPLDAARLHLKAGPLLTTELAQVLTVSCFLCVAISFCPIVGLKPLIQANSMGTALSFLPISISGLGTREASTVTILAHFGVPIERAFLTSILDGFLFPIIVLSLISLAAMIYDRIRNAHPPSGIALRSPAKP